MKKIEVISQRLRDKRGRKIAFVAHCILNENSRFQGGALRSGANTDFMQELHKQGIGIVQMKCPEQQAWGGVQRPLMWLTAGLNGYVMNMFRGLFLTMFTLYTRWQWKWIARKTVAEIWDWTKSGFDVVGIVGISGSPSCGINTTLDIKKGAHYIANIKPGSITREQLNQEGIRRSMINGTGIYIKALQKELRKRSLNVPFFEHDLMAELKADRAIFFNSAVPRVC